MRCENLDTSWLDVHSPTVVMRALVADDNNDNPDYTELAHFVLVADSNGHMIATSDGWLTKTHSSREHLTACWRALYYYHNVRTIRTMRPHKKPMGRWKQCQDPLLSAYHEIRLPQDWPEILMLQIDEAGIPYEA